MIDLEPRLRATFAGVADTTLIPPAPHIDQVDQFADESLEVLATLLGDFDEPPRQPRLRLPRRRRALTAVAAAVVIVGGSLSIAAAAGLPVLPASVMQAFGWAPTPGAVNADPATARYILTTTGPDGRPMQLWYADASNDGYCVALLGPAPAPSVPPQYSNYKGFQVPLYHGQRLTNTGGGSCGPKDEKTFGGEGSLAGTGSTGSTTDPPGPTTFSATVPGAVSVRVVFGDGTQTAPLVIAQGWTAGWITGSQAGRDPYLVGYDANGAIIGRISLKI